MNYFKTGILPLLFFILVQLEVLGESDSLDIEGAVVKITCASQSYIFDQPWEKGNVNTGRGTGFLIAGNRIITNAHVVSDAKYIEVQTSRGAGKYIAEVEFVAHGSDLALLAVDDPSFFEGLHPLEFGYDLPDLDSVVTTYGYPMGGMQLSVTRGVVSRIEMSTYSHSGVEQHLAIQTDAAINPGNSGGPVIQDSKVVGIAFQAMMMAENVGFLIPSIVVGQFLDDIKDGEVDGFGDLAIEYRGDCDNPFVRRVLAMPADMTGVVVTRLFPKMPAWDMLKLMDVIFMIDGHAVSNDGFIFLDGRMVNFLEVVERVQVGSTISLDVWREGQAIKVDLPVKAWVMPVNLANPYGVVPKYFIFGGLAFTPLSKGYVSASGGWDKMHLSVRELYSDAAMLEEYASHKEFPVLARRLADPINVNMDNFVGMVVDSVNGRTVYSMRDLKDSLENSEQDLVEISFMGYDVPLIISRSAATEQGPAILRRYHVEEGERL
ncbi:MAG: trypsin-like peptidase domain-containing protein [Victivallales bacterium]|nr:trypsin-like peptidase domain-containing protein [Victivallales bacterium]